MSEHPLVSIVIPAFNGAQYLAAAVDSVMHQDYDNLELLVFDDGSSDETPDILKRYGDQFYWECQENMGQSATLNKGWKRAIGEILAYLSVDDELAPAAVGRAVATLTHNPGTPVVYGDYDLVNENGENLRRIHAPDFDYRKLVADIEVQPGPGAFFRREVFNLTGGWDPNLNQTPDFDFWLKAGLLGEFEHVSEVWAKFRVHVNSQSFAEASPEKADECVSVIENFYSLPELPADIIGLKSRALSTAHAVSARAHIRAGRYTTAVQHLSRSFTADKRSALNSRTWKLLLSGIRYRLSKLGAAD